MKITNPSNRILKLLLNDFIAQHSVTSVAKEIGLTRQGTFKVLKKLESENLILLSPIGSGKTSACIIRLNWDNPLVEKTLAVILTEDAIKNQRWLVNFAELENKADFLIIYGSILENPKGANDVDIISISNKKNFVELEKAMMKIQKTQIRRIHSLNFTEGEFMEELKKNNPAFIGAIKKGIVLFGQDNFIEFMRRLK